MKLGEALKIIKCKTFVIFIQRDGMDTYKNFEINRNDNGELPESIRYAWAEVTEIIPHFMGVNIVIDVGASYLRSKQRKG